MPIYVKRSDLPKSKPLTDAEEIRATLVKKAKEAADTIENFLPKFESELDRIDAIEPMGTEKKSDIDEARTNVRILKNHISSGNVKAAVYKAFFLGRIIERMDVREFEKFVDIGQKVKKGGYEGAAAKHRNELEARNNAILAVKEYVNSRTAQGTQVSKAVQEASVRFRLSRRTIYTYLKKN